jgi:hypothetical protein
VNGGNTSGSIAYFLEMREMEVARVGHGAPLYALLPGWPTGESKQAHAVRLIRKKASPGMGLGDQVDGRQGSFVFSSVAKVTELLLALSSWKG